ncbi:MAG: 50S ribosomal protein L1 [bacterium]
MKKSKKYKLNLKSIEPNKLYSVNEGVDILKKQKSSKFDETVEVSINLGVEPKKSDQMVRGTVALPHGTGKEVKVLVFCKPPKDKEAKEAGADMVGLDEYIEKIQKGWCETDVVVATPDVMKDVGKLGKFLGPKGLMPNPKAGTVTNDISQAVKQLKAGRIEFRVDKYGIIHTVAGKCSFTAQQLIDNLKALMQEVMRLRPASAKGLYLKGITLSSTMGPGIKLDSSSLIRK